MIIILFYRSFKYYYKLFTEIVTSHNICNICF